MYHISIYGSSLDVFLVFNYWNVDIGMFILRSSILEKISKQYLE